MKASHITFALACAVSAAGCASDRAALDGFSRAYHRFGRAVWYTNEPARKATDEGTEFMKHLRGAMDESATNTFRVSDARIAIAAYDTQTLPLFTVSNESLVPLDASVDALIESANRLKDADARAEANRIAQAARGVHTTLAAYVPLQQKRIELRIEALRGIVAEGGSITAAFDKHVGSAEELQQLNDKCERLGSEALAQWRATKDAFNAMKGRFSLKADEASPDSTGAFSLTRR